MVGRENFGRRYIYTQHISKSDDVKWYEQKTEDESNSQYTPEFFFYVVARLNIPPQKKWAHFTSSLLCSARMFCQQNYFTSPSFYFFSEILIKITCCYQYTIEFLLLIRSQTLQMHHHKITRYSSKAIFWSTKIIFFLFPAAAVQNTFTRHRAPETNEQVSCENTQRETQHHQQCSKKFGDFYTTKLVVRCSNMSAELSCCGAWAGWWWVFGVFIRFIRVYAEMNSMFLICIY